MKNSFVTLLACWMVLAISAADNKAFIVAISNFKNTGYKPISSVNDLQILKESLIKQGFVSIDTLVDAQATKAMIKMKLNEFATTKVKPGDVVYLHFSTHGRQVQDFSKPADEPDGLDECLVAYDSDFMLNKADPAQSVATLLTDDEVGQIIDQIRKKLTAAGDLIVSLDACHSGTGYRGDEQEGEICRGGYDAFTVPGFKPKSAIELNNYNEADGLTDAGKSSYVVFSGSQADIINREFRLPPPIGSVGSLSYAICTALNSLEKQQEQVTYRKFFEDIKEVMSPLERQQLPDMQGNGSDRVLFSGKYIAQDKYYLVDSIRNGIITIKAGFLNKVYEGTKVAICTANTADPSKKDRIITTGTVVRSNNFNSEVQVDSDANIPPSVWVFVTEQAFGKMELKVNISGLSNSAKVWISKIDWKTQGMPFVKLVAGDGDIVISEAGVGLDDGFNLQLPRGEYKNKNSIENINKDGPITSENGLSTALSNFLQYKLLSKLMLTDDTIKLEFQLIPLKNGDTCLKCLEEKIIGGNLYLEEGDTVYVLVKNVGSNKAYFNILDFEPYGNMNLILSGAGQNLNPASDLMVNVFKTKLIRLPIYIRKPFGKETFKLIASGEPIDLSGIIEMSRGTTEPEEDPSVLEKYILNSTGTRGEETAKMKTDQNNGSTYDLNFIIRPKLEKTAVNKPKKSQ